MNPTEIRDKKDGCASNRAELLEKIMPSKWRRANCEKRVVQPRNALNKPASLVGKGVPQNVTPRAEQKRKEYLQ